MRRRVPEMERAALSWEAKVAGAFKSTWWALLSGGVSKAPGDDGVSQWIRGGVLILPLSRLLLNECGTIGKCEGQAHG